MSRERCDDAIPAATMIESLEAGGMRRTALIRAVRCIIGGGEETNEENAANMSTNYAPCDHVDFEPDQPTCFLTLGGVGMYQFPVGRLIRDENTIRFDYCDRTGTEKPLRMVFKDGLYRWAGRSGAHRQAVLTETKTHVVLTGNYSEEDQTQGIEIIVWPIAEVKEIPSVATAAFLSSQRPVWQRPRHPVRGPLPDRPILGEPVKGMDFEMRDVAPTAESTKSVKLNDVRFVWPPPVQDRNCSCGEPASVVVAVMTLRGDRVSDEPFCDNCFAARQIGSSG
jgi:hypothetical protein